MYRHKTVNFKSLITYYRHLLGNSNQLCEKKPAHDTDSKFTRK